MRLLLMDAGAMVDFRLASRLQCATTGPISHCHSLITVHVYCSMCSNIDCIPLA